MISNKNPFSSIRTSSENKNYIMNIAIGKRRVLFRKGSWCILRYVEKDVQWVTEENY